MCESIRYQAKSEQNVRQDLIPRVRGGCSLHPEPLLKLGPTIYLHNVFYSPLQSWVPRLLAYRRDCLVDHADCFVSR